MGINVVSSYANTYTYGNVKDESIKGFEHTKRMIEESYG